MKIKHIAKVIVAAALFSIPTTVNAQLNFDLGGLINSAGQALQNATATTKFTAQELVGTWKYSSPGINFKGDDVLSKLGGAATSTAVESKLAPYYKTAGVDKLQLTVNKDLSFTMTMGKATLKGTISKASDGNLTFKFAAFNKITIGNVSCIATKSGSMLNLTFDASKMLKIAQTVSSVSSNATFQSVNSMLKNYDGLYIGAKMKKVK